jgi:hypothetical protein
MPKPVLYPFPHNARARFHAKDAWWYENKDSIDVYITSSSGGDALTCRIDRKKLTKWLEKTEKNNA